jgi:hypothetical protein
LGSALASGPAWAGGLTWCWCRAKCLVCDGCAALSWVSASSHNILCWCCKHIYACHRPSCCRRNWLETAGGGGPFGRQNADWLRRAGPRLSDEQLLDHYHSHTKHCAACTRALHALRIARIAAGVLAAASAALSANALLLHYTSPLVAGAGLKGAKGAAAAAVSGTAASFIFVSCCAQPRELCYARLMNVVRCKWAD